jgi:hypothetical protein
MLCSRIPYSNYSAVAAAVRRTLTQGGANDALLYSNECGAAIKSSPAHGDSPAWKAPMPKLFPPELDLFSIDNVRHTLHGFGKWLSLTGALLAVLPSLCQHSTDKQVCAVHSNLWGGSISARPPRTR